MAEKANDAIVENIAPLLDSEEEYYSDGEERSYDDEDSDYLLEEADAIENELSNKNSNINHSHHNSNSLQPPSPHVQQQEYDTTTTTSNKETKILSAINKFEQAISSIGEGFDAIHQDLKEQKSTV